jgi:hypothetical protein
MFVITFSIESKEQNGHAYSCCYRTMSRRPIIVLGAASLCSASSITYDVDLTVGAGSVTGDIVTDGAIGVLPQADIIGYNLLLSGPPAGTNTFSLSCCNFFPFSGSDLSATATQLAARTPGKHLLF